MDGLKKALLITLILLFPFAGAAEESVTAENGYVLGNGREFKKTERYEYFVGEEYADIYPLYEDREGIEAYFEGMLILEIRQVEDYDSALAWRVKADSYTTYNDLGITLLEFNDIEKAEEAYSVLRDSKDKNILYMELALIEEQVW